MSMTGPLRDNAALGRYEMDADGETATLYYRIAPGVITLRHTEVPPALGGRGVGSRLARAALEDARARGSKWSRAARSSPPIWASIRSSTICCGKTAQDREPARGLQ